MFRYNKNKGTYNDELLANAKYIRSNIDNGILCVDDSIEKCFSNIDVENVGSIRRSFHDYLISKVGTLKYLNGVILFEESFCHKTIAGKPVLDILKEIFAHSDNGGLSGIIINHDLPFIAKRCAKYYSAGFRVAKLFKTQTIQRPNRPSEDDVEVKSFIMNAETCHENGLIPILDVEIVSDDIEWCALVTADFIGECFCALSFSRDFIPVTHFKPKMVVPGKNVAPVEMAKHFLHVLRNVMPVGVAGVVILENALFQEMLKFEKSIAPWFFISMDSIF